MVLVLKTELNGDLRRIPLHNDFLTFDELHLMLCRVYSCDIDEEDKLKYMDEEGDWVTIQDSSDLQFAIQCVQQRNESTLKLRVGNNQGGIPDEIVNELKSIRDMSISLLDRVAAKSGSSSQKSVSPKKAETVPSESVTELSPAAVVQPVIETKPEDIKSFDPIQGESEEAISYVEPIQTQVVPPVSAPPVSASPISTPVLPPPVAIAPEPMPEPVVPSHAVEPIQQEPVVPTPVVPILPVTPVQEQVAPLPQENVAPVVQPVVPQSFAPTENTGAASFFNSNQSDAGDSFSMSDRGSTIGSSAATPKPVLPPATHSPAPVVPQVSNPQSNNLHGQTQQYNYNAYMHQHQAAPHQQQASHPQQQQQMPQQTAQQPVQQQQAPQPVQQNQYYQQYQQYAQTAGTYGQQYYQQQGYQQQQQPTAAPPQQQPQQQQPASAPPAGPPQVNTPPQGMPAGGYRLNRNARNVRPGYQ